jgi:hypothetical protein
MSTVVALVVLGQVVAVERLVLAAVALYALAVQV